MHIDHAACERFWAGYLEQIPLEHPHHGARPDRFGFGDETTLAEELALLVLARRRRPPSSLAIEFATLGEAQPRVGDLSIVVHGDGRPAALIERTHVVTLPFEDVDATYAAIEGEGDGSLRCWRAAHVKYFHRRLRTARRRRRSAHPGDLPTAARDLAARVSAASRLLALLHNVSYIIGSREMITSRRGADEDGDAHR